MARGKWPQVGEKAPANSDRPWNLVITGCVARESSWSLVDLRALPQTEMTIDIHCVTRWSKLGNRFSGVLLSDLLAIVQPNSDARFVSFLARSDANHSTSLDLSTAIGQQTLISLDYEGQPLPVDHGGPIRNIVPGRYFYKSVKWLERIEVLAEDRLGTWEADSGYHNQADPWLEQRYLAASINKREAARLIGMRDFSGQDLLGIDAQDRDLSGLKACEALLRNANFSGANLSDADFRGANLSNAYFKATTLRSAVFVGADCEGADFSGADLRGADFTGASLFGASFVSENQGTPSGAEFNETTRLPAKALEQLTPRQAEYLILSGVFAK